MYFARVPGPEGVRKIEEEVLVVVSIYVADNQVLGGYQVLPAHLYHCIPTGENFEPIQGLGGTE
jgi:hypothetical protein